MDATAPTFVRPYVLAHERERARQRVLAHERERARQRRRRIALVLAADFGVDLDQRLVGAADVAYAFLGEKAAA